MRRWLGVGTWGMWIALSILGSACTREVVREVLVQPSPAPTPTLAVASPSPEPCTEQLAVSRAEPAVVRIEGAYWYGSGVVVDERGYILTNRHVVEGDRFVTVVLASGQERTGEVWSVASDVDLAIIHVPGARLSVAKWGDSSALRPPDRLIAIGYPMAEFLGGEPSVTAGALSAHRSDGYAEWLQTDVSLNPGSSGGALVNLCGELVGIATSGIRDTEGMNLAIAAATARPAAEEMIKYPISGTAPAQVASDQAKLSPEQTTLLFYLRIANRDFPGAYSLLSQRFRESHPYGAWLAGYDTTLFVSVEEVRSVRDNPPVVYASVLATDFLDNRLVARRFAGEWTLVLEGESWRLEVGKIAVVP